MLYICYYPYVSNLRAYICFYLYRRKRLGELIDKLVADQGELVFDIDLLMVADDENDQGYYEDEAIDDEVLRQYIRKNTKFKDAEVE